MILSLSLCMCVCVRGLVLGLLRGSESRLEERNVSVNDKDGLQVCYIYGLPGQDGGDTVAYFRDISNFYY